MFAKRADGPSDDISSSRYGVFRIKRIRSRTGRAHGRRRRKLPATRSRPRLVNSTRRLNFIAGGPAVDSRHRVLVVPFLGRRDRNFPERPWPSCRTRLIINRGRRYATKTVSVSGTPFPRRRPSLPVRTPPTRLFSAVALSRVFHPVTRLSVRSVAAAAAL